MPSPEGAKDLCRPSGASCGGGPQPTAHANGIYTFFSSSGSPFADKCPYVPTLPEAEPRPPLRYTQLVMAHLSHTQRLAAGLHPPPSISRPFAAVQAAWRFYSNNRVSLPQLAVPLIDCALPDMSPCCRDLLLVMRAAHTPRRPSPLRTPPLPAPVSSSLTPPWDAGTSYQIVNSTHRFCGRTQSPWCRSACNVPVAGE